MLRRPAAPRAADDDAEDVGIFSLDNLPAELAFDHRLMLDDFAEFERRRQQVPSVLLSEAGNADVN